MIFNAKCIMLSTAVIYGLIVAEIDSILIKVNPSDKLRQKSYCSVEQTFELPVGWFTGSIV